MVSAGDGNFRAGFTRGSDDLDEFFERLWSVNFTDVRGIQLRVDII
jgi:hypothetical protein